MKKRILWLVLLGAVHTSWAEQVLIYYTSDPTMQLVNIQTRMVPVDMTIQKFLDTLQPPLPPLDAHTIWTFSSKDLMRTTPDALVVSNEKVGKTSDNPWILTKIAIG